MADLHRKRIETGIREITLANGIKKYSVTLHYPKYSNKTQQYRRCATLEEAREIMIEFRANRAAVVAELKPVALVKTCDDDITCFATSHSWGIAKPCRVFSRWLR